MHDSAHTGVTLTEPQVIGRAVLGRFTLCPIPFAAILQVHDMNGMACDILAVFLTPHVVYAAQTLFKNRGPMIADPIDKTEP